MDAGENEFREWRRAERRKHSVLITIASVGVVAILAIVFSLGGSERKPDGLLPTIAEVERDLKIWAMPGKRGILRGRPLVERCMTRDATTIGYRFTHPPYSLWENSEGEIIGFSCFVISSRIYYEKSIDISDDDLGVHVEAWGFLRKYVGLSDLSDFEFRLTKREETSGTIEESSLAREWIDGFEIEVTRENRFKAGKACDWEYDLIIIKGANW